VNKLRFTQRAVRIAAVSGIAFAAIAPAAAYATPPAYPDGGGTNTPNDPGATQVKGTTATKSATLPFTGGDVAGLALIGAGAVGAGVVIVRQTRRKAVA